jgi:HEAT repeat protein
MSTATKRRPRGAKQRKASSKVDRPLSPRLSVAAAKSQRKTVKERVAAMANTAPAIYGDQDSFQAMIKVLQDTNEPVPVRLAALQALQAASFAVVQFESCRGDYIAALRSVATDADPEIRQRVLGLLARENDGFAQKKLLEGLQDPTKALVPAEKALQLLSYDVHADAYPVARMIVANPPDDMAKQEALRLLAADASAQPLFDRVLRDKDETKEVRQIAASALQSIAPKSFQTAARAMLLDPKEYDDIQATSLTALTNFGDTAKVAKDDKLLKQVGSFQKAQSSKLKQGARAFFAKFSDL